MFSSLHGFKVFWVSLILCVVSSATIHLSIFWFARVFPLFLSSPFLIRDILTTLATVAFVGLLKALPVSAIAYWVKPSLRSRLMIGSTVALSLLEAWIAYELETWTIGVG